MHWKGVGLTHAKNASKLGVNFEFIEDRSDRAATDLARNQRQFDIIFIDGNHKFDDVLVDFYLYAQLCSIGGCIIFDDAVYIRSIRTVVEFIRDNRKDFREIPNVPSNWCAFEKLGKDERHWRHFEKFKVASSQR
jgi:predicted O-methyltransferase YrrM